MKKPPAVKSKPKTKSFGHVKPEVELEEGAWGKFEAMIRRAAKMGHRPHAEEKKKKKRVS
jgi:hypothetical protein